jgi:hypothetical protein
MIKACPHYGGVCLLDMLLPAFFRKQRPIERLPVIRATARSVVKEGLRVLIVFLEPSPPGPPEPSVIGFG